MVSDMFSGIYKFFIRTGAFLTKEMIEVLRQTPLVLTLVLGPFLILLLFGLGYKNEARPLRTLVVMTQKDPTSEQFVQQVFSFGLNLINEGTTDNLDVAMQRLRLGQVDLVAVIPPNAPQTIQNNQQAVIQFYHNEIDPNQVSYVEYITTAYIDEVNRQVVRNYAVQGQQSASSLEQKLADARQRIQTMRQALQAGNATAALSEQQALSGDIDAISLLVGGTMSVVNSTGGQSGGSTTSVSPQNQSILDSLTKLQQSQQNIGAIQAGQSDYNDQLTKLDQMDSDLNNLETQLKEFQSVAPDVLVRPFRAENVDIQKIKLRPADFFAPAVIVLLLQHLAVTFAALALVREQRSGSFELFRISPLSAFETLLGKYLSYILLGAGLAAVITATVIYALGVPMLGKWFNYAIVLLTLLFTALGLGFLISLISKTELQAVQYSMFILLGSVFFSGFFLDLRYLTEAVRIVSWMLPATYAIRLVQAVMLRGDPLDVVIFGVLLGIGLLLYLIVWIALRRRLQSEWS